jgi:hypothetical protein
MIQMVSSIPDYPLPSLLFYFNFRQFSERQNLSCLLKFILINKAIMYPILIVVSTMNAIKANYKVNKAWSGDPCVPIEFPWAGVTCISDSSNIPRITAL